MAALSPPDGHAAAHRLGDGLGHSRVRSDNGNGAVDALSMELVRHKGRYKGKNQGVNGCLQIKGQCADDIDHGIEHCGNGADAKGQLGFGQPDAQDIKSRCYFFY